jgi:hypothetical protein
MLAFEYQGEGHYTDINMFDSYAVYKHRDMRKRALSNTFGTTVIEIPYWWDRSTESLIATIQKYRPDIPMPAVQATPISSTHEVLRSPCIQDFVWITRLYWRFYCNSVATDYSRLLQGCNRISNTISSSDQPLKISNTISIILQLTCQAVHLPTKPLEWQQ